MESLADIKIDSDIKSLELYSDKYPFRLAMRISNFENEASFNKFIKNCEKIVRGSLEYREWKNYIIDVLGVNECMITHENIAELTLEVHHHVPSLFAVVKAIVSKHIEQGNKFSTFDIALETMEMHFQNKIGYAILIKSMHEKFHNGYLNLPISKIRGDYVGFIKEYGKYMDEDDHNTINERMTIDEANCGWSKDNYDNTEVPMDKEAF